MPGFTETTFYDSFATLTIKNFSKEFQKQFITHRPAVEMLFDGNRYTDAKGGQLWQGIAEYGFNPSVKFFDGADQFSQEVGQFAQPMIYRWRYMGASISMLKTEMLENRGPVALASLIEGRLRQVMRTMNLIIGNEIFGDGTNYGGKTIIGLAAAISTTPTVNATAGNVGSIDATVFKWWQNNAVTSFGSFAAHGVNGTSDDLVLRTWNNCTDGPRTPTTILSDQATFEYYNKTLLAPVRFVDQVGGTADLSFKKLAYKDKTWTLTADTMDMVAAQGCN